MLPRVLACLGLACTILGQTSLDVNVQIRGAGSNPRSFTNLGPSTLFIANTDATGAELFATDGTPGGARLVLDIWPGPDSSEPDDFVLAGGTLYFSASDGVSGRELWATDGTAAGTRLVADLEPGPNGSNPLWLSPLGGSILFQADTTGAGQELWRSDGTAAGTVMVADLNPGAADSQPIQLESFGTHVMFAAIDGFGRELWRSDGTAAGTARITDINPGSAHSIPRSLRLFCRLGSLLLFAAEDGVSGIELWVSDGSSAGTTQLRDINPGAADSLPNYGEAHNGELFFYARDASSGGELWKSDGTPAGTMLVADIGPGPVGSEPSQLTSTAGFLFFIAIDGGFSRLFRTDGTSGGSLMLPPPPGFGSVASGLTALGSSILFSGRDANGTELWISDGTVAGTTMLYEIEPGGPFGGGAPQELALHPSGTRMLFSAELPTLGRELWSSDGTNAGTMLLDNIQVDNRTESASPRDLVRLGDFAYFTADDGVTGRELWRSDGTPSGTSQVVDLLPGSGFGFGQSHGLLAATTELLFMVADDGPFGDELWCSDGTAAGTRRLTDIAPGAASASIANLTPVEDRLFFVAGDAAGNELWTSDGTVAGTRRVADIAAGPASSAIDRMFAFGSLLVFEADDGSSGPEPWFSDGTSAGTGQLADIAAGPNGSFFRPLGVFEGRLYFGADDGVAGNELWRTDGTPGGTALFADIFPGPTGSWPFPMFAATSTHFYLYARAPSVDREVIRCDSNPANVIAVTDVGRGSRAAGISQMWTANDQLLFAASGDPSAGNEIWTLDPTATNGARLLADLATGTLGSFAQGMIPVGSRNSMFSARQGDASNYELWQCDANVVKLVAEFEPGPAGSIPSSLVNLGNRVLCVAQTDAHGSDLWSVEAGGAVAKPFGHGCASGVFAPVLRVTDPVLGGVMTFRGALTTGSVGVIGLGLPRTPPLSISGCDLFLQPAGLTFWFNYTPIQGRWSQAMPLPILRVLEGLRVAVQGITFSGAPGGGFDLSNPVELVFGH